MKLLLKDSTVQLWTWMMVSEIELPYAQNIQIFVLTHSTIFAAIKQITTMGPVLEVLVFKCLGDIGIAIQCSPKETSCIVSCWNRASTWKSFLNSNQDPIPQVRNYFKRAVAKETEPSVAKTCQSRTEESLATQECSFQSRVLFDSDFRDKGSGAAFFPNTWYLEDVVSTEISKLVMILGLRCDQDEEIRRDEIAKCVPEVQKRRILGRVISFRTGQSEAR